MLLQVVGDLLDQEISEGNPFQPFLAVGDRIENRCFRVFRIFRHPFRIEHVRNLGRHALEEGNLHENQGFIGHARMEKGKTAAVFGFQPAPQFFPGWDFMHRFVGNDLLQDVGWCGPVDCAHDKETAVEPGTKHVAEIFVYTFQDGIVPRFFKQCLPHSHQTDGAVRHGIQTAEEFLPWRFRRLHQAAEIFRILIVSILLSSTYDLPGIDIVFLRQQHEKPVALLRVGFCITLQKTVGIDQRRCFPFGFKHQSRQHFQ